MSISEIESKLAHVLKSAGYSYTKPRRVIFETLQGREPQSMAGLIAKTSKYIDRATAYRTMELFENLNIVHRINFGWKYKIELSDQFNHHHHHLACITCGKVIPIEEDEALEILLARAAKAEGFVMQSHQIEVQGVCKSCSRP